MPRPMARSRSHSPRGTSALRKRPDSRNRGSRPLHRDRHGVASPPPTARKSDRSPSPGNRHSLRRKGRDYASPSPPGRHGRSVSPSRDSRTNIRVTASAVGGGRRAIKETIVKNPHREEEVDDGKRYPAEGSRTRGEHGAIFKGAEFGHVEAKEQKKIQIDIRRSIPAHRISKSPIRRGIEDPTRIVISRKIDEGVKTIFDRDEIRLWIPSDPEERVINLIKHDQDRRAGGAGVATRPTFRDRSRSPLKPSTDLRSRISDDRHEGILASRSFRQDASEMTRRDDGKQFRQDDRRSFRQDHEISTFQRDDGRQFRPDDGRRPSVRDRLGPASEGKRFQAPEGLSSRLGVKEDMDEDRMMDREELESRRPTTKPWDINPEFVPRGSNYFEHDNRESFEENNHFPYSGNDRGRGFSRGRGYRGFESRPYRGWGRGRGRGNNGEWRGGREFYGSRPRGNYSPAWKHDLYEQQEEPSSTTNE